VNERVETMGPHYGCAPGFREDGGYHAAHVGARRGRPVAAV